MRLSILFLALVASFNAADALKPSAAHGLMPRHLHLKNRATTSNKSRCRRLKSSTSSSLKSKTTTKTSTVVKAKATTTKTSTKAASTSKAVTNLSKGTVQVASYCGGPGATSSSTKTTGPNGAEWWLNCGVDSSTGWRPPTITAAQVISKDLADVIDGSVFSPCKKYLSFFTKWGGVYDIPPIMLAAFALQESSCNAYPSGGDGHGLMQITTDKCGDAPNGNCEDPNFNIMSGARYFASVVKSHNGNLVQSVGEYNGWNYGMTVAQAKEEPGGCVTQRNLDYLHQFFNGWLQGLSTDNMGTYFNLAKC